MKRNLSRALVLCLALLLTAALAAIPAAAAELSGPPAPPLVMLALQQAQLTAADGAAGDRFGWRVAISGDSALVGVPGADVGGNLDQGSAYVFVRSGGAWSLQTKLTAADGAASDEFGHDVALDGDMALVGAAGDDVGSNIDQGSAYVFVRSGSSWSQQALLTAADGAANDWFAQAVALDGDRAVVGAYGDDVGSNIDQGSASVFVRSGSTWSQQQKLTVADGAANDWFGYSVALSGNSALVGAPGDDVGSNREQGSASVFVRSGSTWSRQAKLTGTAGAAPADFFGEGAVALDGGRALVGAPWGDVGSNRDQGSAYVFALEGAPVTSASRSPLANAAGWNRTAVTVTLSATDDVSGVDETYYRLGGVGAYSVYDAAAKPVVSTNGLTRVWFYSRDTAGNVEIAKSLGVRIDTTRPVTKALAKATVRRGGKVTLRLRVNDAVSPKATVTVKIYKGAALKRTLRLGLRRTNAEIRYSYTCRLARGTYTWKVYATDLADNRQIKIGHKTLTVR